MNKLSTLRRLKNFIKDSDLPVTVLSGGSNIEIIGNGRVIVENANRILEYQNECVRLCADKFIVVVKGLSLTLCSFDDNVIVIDGNIKNICLE